MATSNSVNHNPTFPIPGADTDAFSSEMLEIGLSALDLDDHSLNKGPPVKRITGGLLSARPAAGNLGHVYAASDTNQLFWDNGSSWLAVVVEGTGVTATGLLLLNGGATGTGGKLQIKDSGGTARTALYSTDGDTLRIYPMKSTGNIVIRNYADTLNNVVISDAGSIDASGATTGDITAKGKMVANGYRTALQPFAADYLIQTGTAVSSNAAEVTVTFTTASPNNGVAFAGTPQVVLTVLSATSVTYAARVATVSNTAFTFSVYDKADTRLNTITVMWLAMGTR